MDTDELTDFEIESMIEMLKVVKASRLEVIDMYECRECGMFTTDPSPCAKCANASQDAQ